jgi:hypothetical protein
MTTRVILSMETLGFEAFGSKTPFFTSAGLSQLTTASW